jgi:hypothetical protein
MEDIIPAAIAGASAGAALGLGWLGAFSLAILNVALRAAAIRKG